VLLYGHDKNAYWFGSRLSLAETRELAPYQNATGLQVTSAVLAGMVWALENPTAGIVEADEIDFKRCLESADTLSRPGEGLLHRLDAARAVPAARACSRKISTRRDPVAAVKQER
jgi:homospermidine synthase